MKEDLKTNQMNRRRKKDEEGIIMRRIIIRIQIEIDMCEE